MSVWVWAGAHISVCTHSGKEFLLFVMGRNGKQMAQLLHDLIKSPCFCCCGYTFVKICHLLENTADGPLVLLSTVFSGSEKKGTLCLFSFFSFFNSALLE